MKAGLRARDFLSMAHEHGFQSDATLASTELDDSEHPLQQTT